MIELNNETDDKGRERVTEQLKKAKSGEIFICSNCGALLRSEATECGLCGAEMEKEVEEEEIEEERAEEAIYICAKCGSFIGARVEKCDICGAVVGEAKEVERRIETRLEYLARMYSSNKAEQAEEEEEEEK